MTPDDLTAHIRNEILEANLAAYRRGLEGDDECARKASRNLDDFYRSLRADQKAAFMASVRQVMVDTLSNVLGLFDGVTTLKDHRDYFHLTYGEDPRDLNGELQDVFLSSVTDCSPGGDCGFGTPLLHSKRDALEQS